MTGVRAAGAWAMRLLLLGLLVAPALMFNAVQLAILVNMSGLRDRSLF
jgi:hypothetical protein